MPQLIKFLVIENLGEIVLYRIRSNHIAGGHIDTKWSHQSVKLCSHRNTIATVNVIFADGRNRANFKYNAIIKCNVANIFQRAANRFGCERQIFQRGIHIHCCAVVQANDSRYKHPALQNKFLFVLRSRKADKQTLEHIVLQNHLCRDIFLFCDIANFCFQAHCTTHRSTSKY